jgi:hypothetical protein
MHRVLIIDILILRVIDPEAPTGDEILSEDEAFDALESQPQPQPQPASLQPGLLRPGVVHRLDKGTTGAECCRISAVSICEPPTTCNAGRMLARQAGHLVGMSTVTRDRCALQA